LTRGARLRSAVLDASAGCVWHGARVAGDPPPPLCGSRLAVWGSATAEEGDVRVTTAYHRMLGRPGVWVSDGEFSEGAMIVTVALGPKRPVCSGCGARGLKDQGSCVRRWRHLDVGGWRCVIECRLRRLECPGWGESPELVQ
jgi:zinc-finger of transposase IS204/IS1001/IS1096/IS1165